MSTLPSDVVLYGSADMPEADGVTVGGAVDTSTYVFFTDISANDTVDWVSSSASDTAVKAQISGRDSTGVIQTPAAVTLTGQTKVDGNQTFQRLLYGIITGAVSGTFPLTNPGGSAAVGDVACLRHTATISSHTGRTGSADAVSTTPALFFLQTGDGASVTVGMIIQTTGGTGPNQLRQVIATSGYGTDVVAVNRDWGTVPDNTTTYNVNQGMLFPILPNAVTKVTRCFATAAADVPGGAARYFYEKIFAVNNNTATALVSATVQISSDTPSLPAGALLDIGVTATLNDTNTATARQQASNFLPTGVSAFVTQPSAVAVPSPGNLPPGVAPNAAGAEGVWMRLTLPAGVGTYNGAANFQTNGQTI